MKFKTLQQWLSWQETLNPAEIDLGLERIEQVMSQAKLADTFDCPLIIVAGTNGKGSVVASLEAIATQAGYRVCSYTSPHLHHYNERIKINGECVSDAELCDAFARIDHARDAVALTYFEFGTLAAIDLFHRADTDLIILEIGLGGRLDAVNVMQPDVSIITSIALDHTDWLGDNREAIATEKAGVMRAGKVTVIGDLQPPGSLYQQAEKTAAITSTIQRDFVVASWNTGWSLTTDTTELQQLPLPALAGEHQINNAACAVMALSLLQDSLPVKADAIRAGLQKVSLAGRYQCVQQASKTRPEIVVDVAHNPQAIAALVKLCQQDRVAGRTILVLAMLADKPVADIITLLDAVVDVWQVAGLDAVPRGLSAPELAEHMAEHIKQAGTDVKLDVHETVEQACAAAWQAAGENDRILVTGSFYTVADALRYFATHTITG